jgi:flagellar hook-length control protein FliK
MMSAKTVLTDAPMCPTPAAPNNAATAPPAGGAPSDFQNVLAGAVPPLLEPTLTDTLQAPPPPLQPLVQLLGLKQQQNLANEAVVVPATKPSTVSPVDLLKILNDNAALLPGAGASADAAHAIADEVGEDDEPVTVDEDTLSEWLDMMLPPSVFAPQAGATNAAGTNPEDGPVDLRSGVTLAALPASLVLQAGLPGANEVTETPAAGIPLTINRDAAGMAAAAQSTAAAFVAALAPKTDAAEPVAPTTESWMNAMGDLTSKRAADLAPVPESRLSTPVHDARWADALAHRLVLMARDGESVASLKLIPVDLGPLDIQIRVRDGEASVHFGAAHQETRAVLEASMPRLRELLSAQGLQLANASVSHQSAGQNRPERTASGGAIRAVTEDGEVAKVMSTSLLDIYA